MRLRESPRRYRAEVRGDVDTLVMTALQLDPARRYRDAQALAEDLRRLRARERVLARPDSLGYRTRRLIARHRAIVAATAIVVLCLSGALAAVAWTAIEAITQAQLAREHARSTEAVATFLQDLFRANTVHLDDPELARRLTARELLGIGAKKIDASMDDALAAKLRMYDTLAEMYDQLNLNDDAIALSRARLALARAQHGPEAAEWQLDALVDLARQLSQQKYSQESLALAREAATLAGKLPGNRTQAEPRLAEAYSA